MPIPSTIKTKTSVIIKYDNKFSLSMICEQCGADVPFLKPVYIEKAKLMVCPKCAKFSSASASETKSTPMDVVQERLEKRAKRMSEKDVFESIDILDPDYGKIIREARVKKNISVEDLAKDIGIKRNILSKIEAQHLKPEEDLIKKLEKKLNIKLKIKQEYSVSVKKSEEKGGLLTLGDFVKIKKK